MYKLRVSSSYIFNQCCILKFWANLCICAVFYKIMHILPQFLGCKALSFQKSPKCIDFGSFRTNRPNLKK